MLARRLLNIWHIALLHRAIDIRTATILLIFPTYVLTRLVSVLFSANRMLLFGAAGIVISPVLALIGW